MAFEKAGKLQTLVSAATVDWNVGAGANASLVLTINGTMAAPVGMVPGTNYALKVEQGGAGGFTLGFNPSFKFTDDIAPVITVALSKIDVLEFWSDGVFMYLTGIVQNAST